MLCCLLRESEALPEKKRAPSCNPTADAVGKRAVDTRQPTLRRGQNRTNMDLFRTQTKDRIGAEVDFGAQNWWRLQNQYQIPRRVCGKNEWLVLHFESRQGRHGLLRKRKLIAWHLFGPATVNCAANEFLADAQVFC